MTHDERTRLIARVIAREGPPAGAAFPCPYLAGRSARQATLVPHPLTPGVYHSLMDLNFRRLGPLFYRPRCDACQECRMIRVPVSTFRPSRSQRRCQARNADLSIEMGQPRPSAEKHRLYRRYLDARHDGTMDGSAAEFHAFLYTSALDTMEVCYLAHGRLVAVAIADVEPLAMSAVYCYFDPEEAARSLGVFSVLWMLEESRRRGLEHLYLGYYIRDCPKMSYKAGYRPCEVLEPDGSWLRV